MIVCEPCGGTRFEPTQYQNVYGMASLVRCMTCGTCRYDKPQADPRHYYNSPGAYADAERSYIHGAANNPDPLCRWKYERVHRDIYRHMIHNIGWILQRRIDNLYEAACGWGEFLEIAQIVGIRELGGCELNRRLVELAGNHVGVPVEWAPWQEAQVPGDRESIVMLDYLEHTLTPYADLCKAREHLSPDGVLLLKTFLHEWHEGRDLDLSEDAWYRISLDPYSRNETAGYFNPFEHPWHFTEPSLFRLLDGARLDIALIERDAGYGQITIYARRKQ